ncbi:MAG: threonine/serine dehydratase [Pseudomonadota bacterium]|nr:threonine/serine dehydratase [Pseudomonadota bacterium]
MISRRDIAATHAAILPHIRRTPVLTAVVEDIQRTATFKLETLQHTGSFKARGAFANLAGAAIPEAGVVAASGGNHGAAVAFAAKTLAHRARIFVPAASPPAKVARIRSYGAEVVQEGASYAEALARSADYAAATGALAIHAYDVPLTVRGQGTIAREFEEQASDLDTVLVAVGGGGLIAGVATWYAGRTKIIGVEPATCATLERALAAGAPVDILPSGLAVDSLGASRIGDIAFAVARAHVERVVLVGDADIRAAQTWLWQRLRLLTEPGGAAAFAALLCGAYRPPADARVGVILCGANVDPASFGSPLARS